MKKSPCDFKNSLQFLRTVSTYMEISQALQWIFEAKVFLDEATKSINSQILSLILLDVYDSLKKVGTMGGGSRTEIMSVRI